MSTKLITAEIISTGTELLQGFYPDTNAQYLSQVCGEVGISVKFHTAVGDDAETLTQALSIAAERVDIVIIGGGLGPTADDVTREVIARFLNRPLITDAEACERIRQRFLQRGIPLQEYVFQQARIPADSIIMHNTEGTAPGFIVPARPPYPCIIALPGPPRELRPMVEQNVIPYLRQHYAGAVFLRTSIIRTVGVPESVINATLSDLFKCNKQLRLALLAKVGMVDIRINTQATTAEEAERLLADYRQKILARLLPEDVYGFDDANLEQVVGQLLIKNKLHIACAESCTGGFLSMRLTEVPGSSKYITENYVTYSNEAKVKILGVNPETIRRNGAVSTQTACEMAEKVRNLAGADIGISITGIAGPSGGTA
ncbi:MAG: competence/damage-inducible protein A, partial [Candidatus Sumerlaeia bacterium]|nr:competence/damage-inducible protein A [Candidatus Sumerlaeia bacterium]